MASGLHRLVEAADDSWSAEAGDQGRVVYLGV